MSKSLGLAMFLSGIISCSRSVTIKLGKSMEESDCDVITKSDFEMVLQINQHAVKTSFVPLSVDERFTKKIDKNTNKYLLHDGICHF